MKDQVTINPESFVTTGYVGLKSQEGRHYTFDLLCSHQIVDLAKLIADAIEVPETGGSYLLRVAFNIEVLDKIEVSTTSDQAIPPAADGCFTQLVDYEEDSI